MRKLGTKDIETITLLKVVCLDCGDFEDLQRQSKRSEDSLIYALDSRGWMANEDGPLCPYCKEKYLENEFSL